MLDLFAGREHYLTQGIPVADPAAIPPDEKQKPSLGKGMDTDPLVAALSPSRLGPGKRRTVRNMAIQAAALGLARAPGLHYTQGPRRWDGIDEHLKAWKGQCPHYADCSAFATWCLWNGLDHYHLRDIPNGQGWKAGYTGTLLVHGERVSDLRHVHRGDLAIYGNGWPGEHVAVCIGGGYVISHGSEGGPYKLPLNYRPDLIQVRRYI